MRFYSLTSILAALAAAVIAKPLSGLHRPSPHVVHEKVASYQSTWTKAHRVQESATLPVRIGLTQQNLHRAEEFVDNVAHPDSPNYGKHWTPHEVVEMFKPRKESVQAVMEWLGVEGIHPSRVTLSTSKTWLAFDASVREMEQLLKTKYHVFKHDTARGAQHVACDEYHIPGHLTEHIDMITPTVHFDRGLGHDRISNKEALPEENLPELKNRMALERRQTAVTGIVGGPQDASNPKQGAEVDNAMMTLDQCDTMITPGCLRALYNMPRENIPKGGRTSIYNTLGIVEYTPQAFLQSDLDIFNAEFQPRAKGRSPIVVLLDNAVVQTENRTFNFNGESALDLEYAMALIYPQQATLFQVGDTVQGASFNNFLDTIDGSYCTFEGGDSRNATIDGQYAARINCGVAKPTSVISTSYGSNEADLTPRYEQRQCDEYMKLALLGISVIYSSGDFGVAGNGGQCIEDTTEGSVFNNGTSGRFNPSFPGGCPWVTSVGATQVLNGSSVKDPEAACERVIRSGGGFSNVFAMPKYQREAVESYLENNKPPYTTAQYNTSGVARGFPDVSANGANYVTVVDGKFSLSYGTSGEFLGHPHPRLPSAHVIPADTLQLA